MPEAAPWPYLKNAGDSHGMDPATKPDNFSTWPILTSPDSAAVAEPSGSAIPPYRTSCGRQVVRLTEEQRYTFDKNVRTPDDICRLMTLTTVRVPTATGMALHTQCSERE